MVSSETETERYTMRRQARAYRQRLCELVLCIEVTDGEGVSLELDDGSMLAVEMILGVRASQGKIMIGGNGGSAAIASHLQTDLCGSLGMRALAFDGPGMLTALSNDHGYASVFERPIRLWANPGDLLVTISSSGESENILRSVDAARARGCQVITLSGFRPDNRLRNLGNLNFYVPAQAYGFVEVAHAALGHFIADGAIMLRLQQAQQVKAEVWSPSDRSS